MTLNCVSYIVALISALTLFWSAWDLHGPIQIGSYLVSARYGVYRQDVEFRQGMTLYPGQRATVIKWRCQEREGGIACEAQ